MGPIAASKSPIVQTVHVGGRNGTPLVSVFVRADDTFQVVDERKSRQVTLKG